MANRTYQPVAALDREVKMLFGVVTFGGSGAVSSVDALGFTVTKVGATTGRYRVTLADKYGSLLGVSLTLYNGGTAADSKLQLHAELSSNTIVDFQYIGGAVAADATSGHKAYITVFVRNSALTRTGL
jgi:hypothetical protein